tara:strand:- start:213 stop:494 length:282 start_codon:yes stop_codon:yes gene_type:complete
MNDYVSFFSSSAFLISGLSSSQKTLIFSVKLSDYWGPPLIAASALKACSINQPGCIRVKNADISWRTRRQMAHIDTEDSCWMNGHLGKRLHQR